MDIHHRVEMITTLLDDADQHMQALDDALATKALAEAASDHPELHRINAERHLWEKIGQDLYRVRSMFADLGQLEQQRSEST
jgi:hypothetical protein